MLLKNKINLGVGGATIRGFRKAIKLDHDIVFKIDGDNQHNPDDLIKLAMRAAKQLPAETTLSSGPSETRSSGTMLKSPFRSPTFLKKARSGRSLYGQV